MAYRLYRSETGVLIRAGDGEIELSTEDAARLAAELVPAPAVAPGQRQRWTPEMKEQVRSLYVDQRIGATEIARRFNVTLAAVTALIHRMKLPAKNQLISARMVARHAARRAA